MTDPIKPVAPTTPPVSSVSTNAVDPKDILKLLTEVAELKQKVEAKEASTKRAAPVEEAPIDWSKVTEQQVADLNFPIPVFEHEIPEYMNVYLKDQNYVAKWGHVTARRLGMLLAGGYDYIKKEDWDPNYPNILNFNSEGHLVYDDVVALKVHKSRYFGKIRREHQKSTAISNVAGYAKVKGAVGQAIANNPRMEAAMNRGAMTFYGEGVESNIEVNV